jgi:hypothetical protein
MDDVLNIALLCALIGLGAGLTFAVLIAYAATLAFMEDHFD